MKNKTLWMENVENIENKKDFNEQKTDILIIGGGMAGLSCAYYLKDINKKVILIEKDKIGCGVTARSTAKITFLQQLIYQKISGTHNFNTAKLYYESQKEAINILDEVIEKEKIDCDYNKVSSITFTNDFKNLDKLKKEQEFFKKVNQPFKVIKSVPYFNIKYGIEVDDTAVFHPLKFLNGINEIVKDKVSVYENVRALEIKNEKGFFSVNTNKGNINARTVIVCTHYPFFIIPGLIPLKSHIERDYVAASKVEKTDNISMITYEDKPLHSLRYHCDKDNNYVVYASASHLSTMNIDYNKKYKFLEKEFKKHIKEEPLYEWVNHDVITNDHLPIIGEVDKNLYIATGFNTWGMTNGWLSGKIISDNIKGIHNKYTKVVSPKRKITFLRTMNFLKDMALYIKIMVQTTLVKNHKFYKNVYIKYENGMPYGIYIDENNKKHKCKNKCPHMKCNLIFNQKEKTWDCPCHGSRFDVDGNLITGPSKKNI